MSTFDDDFRYESIQDRESIVKYLTVLGEGIQNGRLLFGTRRKKLILEPGGLLKLEVKAKRKDRKVKLNLQISWSSDKEKGSAGADSLEIKAGKKR